MVSRLNITSDHFRTVEDIFHAALSVAPDELDGLLEERCGGNALLRSEVEALLAAHGSAAGFIDVPVVPPEARLFDDGSDDPLIGQRLGQYEIRERIGSGGMGVVYLARRADRQYEKRVAIKLIKRGMDTDAVLRHFRNERQILAGFDHPNIARLLDGDTTESGLPYFVMEYVEGLPIDEYCEREMLSVDRRLQLFRQVCAAVSYAHRRAVIHRDIKTSNILVGADGVPKLLDFGIAKILQPGTPGVDSAATMIGLRVMTPEYASPEQVRGEPATTVSDVYSLGVVLYRMLTGRLPYRLASRAPLDLARTIAETQPQPPSDVVVETDDSHRSAGQDIRGMTPGDIERLRRRLRGDLDNIVLMALRKEPERRYQSVEQFSDDIGRHLATLPVLARADTLTYRATKFVRRNAAATVAATLVVLSLVGGIVATTWQAQKARAQEALAQAEKIRAERRFNDVRQLAHKVLFDYHDAIRDLPGATAVRELLVKDALAYLDSLAAEAAGDRELQRELAAAYDRVGDVRGRSYSAANLGDAAGAIESFRKALQIREALVAANPEDLVSRRDLGASYVKVGAQLLDTSESELGLAYLRKGLEVNQQLATEQPTNAEFLTDLAVTYNALGLALEDRGEVSAALETHHKALALREALVAAEPADERRRRSLSITYINLSRAQVLSGDVDGGLESNGRALAICVTLLAGNPSNTDYRRLLANTYQNDGDYRTMLRDTPGALASFRRKLALDQQALTDDPVNAVARGDLAYTYERIGFLLAESGANREALLHYGKGLAIYEGLSADSSDDVYLRYRSIITRASVGKLEAQVGDRSGALAECSTAITLLEQIAEDPANSLQTSLRAQTYMQVAAAYAALAGASHGTPTQRREQWRAAREMYARSLEIWQIMQRRGILAADDAGYPAEVARGIARCDAALERIAS